jgi:hypothetical protein
MVVVLPLPLTPTTSTTCGLRAASMVSGTATGCRISAMSSAKAARTSSSVTSLPKRSLPSLATSLLATVTPRSAWISTSSRSSSVCWSSFFLVKRPVMLSATFFVDFESPSRRRESQPFFSVSGFSTSGFFSAAASTGAGSGSATTAGSGGCGVSTSGSTGLGGSTAGVPRRNRENQPPFFSGSVSLTAAPQESRERSSSPR